MNNDMNGFNGGQMMQMPNALDNGRALAEVQAQIFLAKQFPRDEFKCAERIISACKRKGLAETGIYSYPRGSTTVTGPSIRLVETIAQLWGSIIANWEEVERKDGVSTVMCYAWDTETNFRDVATIKIEHKRWANNRMQELKDPRDIYEHVANFATRRKRACILAVIPGDIVESAVEQCEKTLQGAYKTPLKDRLIEMLTKVKQNYGVTQPMIEERFGYKLDAFTEHDYVKLISIFKSISDGQSKREDHFKLNTTPLAVVSGGKTSLEQQFQQKGEQPQ